MFNRRANFIFRYLA